VIAALDFDSDAVAVTRENLALNHIPEGVVEASVADVTRDPLPTARLVVANILASVLIQAADRIAATVAPGGALVLSGILDTQFAEVEAAYAAHGFRCEESVLDAEWRSGLFRKPCAPEAAVLR
jgi:ribosomal protein L11 methyltransferase